MTAGRIRNARQRLEALHAQVEQQREAALRVTGDAGDGSLHEVQWPVALVPKHRARLRRLAARRKRALLERVRALVNTVRRTTAADDERTLDTPAELDDISTRVVVATCSACRGSCCGNGGDHAFLRTRTLRDFIAANPTLDDDGVVAAYAAWLPERTSHPGCVYQGEQGCMLPRAMRSSICNAYLCGGLRRALLVANSDTRGVFVAHRDGDRVSGGRLRVLPVLMQE
jgi:hypothetical protein